MIPISKPIIAKNAKKYLLECLSSGWVSSKGPFIDKFETAFAKFTGTKYAIATPSGTSAIHLILAALGIGPGDEIVVPAFTMIAACLPVIYVGATPVLVDSEEDTQNIEPFCVEEKINKKTKAIIVVHLNGHPVNLAPLLKLKKKYKIALIEDAAESHGALYKTPKNGWKMVGSIGDAGCFSFYGNKIITCGEGGMVVTNNKRLASNIRSLRNLARTPGKHFYHKQIAFAYRMSSLQAALGLAQLEQAQKIIELKKDLASLYKYNLKDLPYLILPDEKSYAKRIYWNFDILLKHNSPITRDQLVKILETKAVESRIFVTPLHKQPAFTKLGLFKGEKYPIAEKLSKQGLSLPLGPNINKKDVILICNVIRKAMR